MAGTGSKIIVWIGVLAVVALPVPAQQFHLDNLPATTGNTRFFRDAFEVRHPSLSLNGFRCADLPAQGCAYGLGVAEVLEAVYGDAPVAAVGEVYEQLLDVAAEALVFTPADRGQVIENTVRLEARAFVALVTYILEQNGNDLGSLNARTRTALPTHAEALDRFKEGVLLPDVYRVTPAFTDDAVKWTTAVTNVARALDLYLALENAYQYYGDAEYDDEVATRLLSCYEKGAWVAYAVSSMRELHDLSRQLIISLPLIRVRRDEVQPGNWPMKVQVALGYATLAQQTHDGRCYPVETVSYDDWLRRALESAGGPTDQDRARHWHYQTAGGKRFFAEGPYYFHFSLGEILPFWHAIRINALLDAHPDFVVEDPFRASWLIQPLDWLADLATPDGGVPALDDGNKVDMRDAALMRWAAAYGDENIGRKMAWIADATGRGWGVSRDLLLVEMAIPRLEAGGGAPPLATVGNTEASQTGTGGEQQLILRRVAEDASMHYVLLNGESGDALRRGEGHEQGDQMQLLYYVDDVSYLLDSGYDNAVGIDNSTWNHYADHNVMTMDLQAGNREGGVKQPRVRIDKQRIVSNHQDVEVLYRTTSGQVDILTAQITLDPDDQLGEGPTGIYRRTVLFINDPRKPYLVDLNAVTGTAAAPSVFAMHYHGNADGMSHTPEHDGYAVWQNLWADTRNPQRTGARLFIRPFSVEYPVKASMTEDRAREGLDAERTIIRLDVEGGAAGSSVSRDHTTVAFIRALPDPSESPGVSLPAAVYRHQDAGVLEDSALTWRYYTWPHDSTTLDVLAVRSAAVYRQPALRTDARLDVRTATHTLSLAFSADDDYGFARLRYDLLGESWYVDPSYQHRLRLASAQPVGREEPAGPRLFYLDQNAPNPFRDTTEIRYALADAGTVQLVVYDVSGREVARLVDAWQAAGVYRVLWDAHGVASGVYLGRLMTDKFSATRQMVVRK